MKGYIIRKLRKLAKKIYFLLINIVRWLTAWPFLEPRIGVILYATFAGIILSVGIDFLLRFFENDELRPWGLTQWAGVLFIAASCVVSGVAWLQQSFYDHLRNVSKDKTSLKEKRVQFNSWDDRLRISSLAFLAIIILIVAFAILISAVAAKPTPSTIND